MGENVIPPGRLTTDQALIRLGRRPGSGTEIAPLPHEKAPRTGRGSGLNGRRPNLYRVADVELARQLVIHADISVPQAVRVVLAIRRGRITLQENP